MSHLLRKPQQGAVAVIVALWMGVALSCLMVLDIGNLFWQQRELQKIADLAALAGASGGVESGCRSNAGAAALENAKSNGWKGTSGTLSANAGIWQPNAGELHSFFQAGGAPTNACHVKVTNTVPYFFVFPASDGGRRTIKAEATALQGSRVAKLSIRSTLATISSKDSVVLNALLGGLLGGSLDVNAVGWNGLLNTKLDLLTFLDLLAIELGVKAGDYKSLLDADVGVGQLLNVMANAVEQSSNTLTAQAGVLRDLAKVALGVPSLRLRLVELIKLQTGLNRAAMETNLNVFELVQAFIQVGNSNHAVQGDIKVPIPGLLGVVVRLRIIEPPQIAAIGDPDLAELDPLGPNKLYVRTAQIRVLASVDLGVVDGLMTAVNGLLKLLSPVTALLGALTGANGFSDLELLPAPARLDISLETGGGQSYITRAQCAAESKKLFTYVRTAAADIRIGRMGKTADEAAQNVLGSQNPIANAPVPVLDFGCIGCEGFGVRTPQYFGGLGIEVNTPVAANEFLEVETDNPPMLNKEPAWQLFKTRDIVKTLSDTVTSLDKLLQPLPSKSPGGLQEILKSIDFLLDRVLKLVGKIVEEVLSPLLDPLVNLLLKALGINLAATEIGAQLDCGGGAELVY